MADAPNRLPKDQESILGLSTSELAGLTVDEMCNNKTAITMLMHYYKKLVDENSTLNNHVNTLQTYVDGYQRKKTYSHIGAILLTVSNIVIGFGVNLLTTSVDWPGAATLIPGVVLAATGLYFSIKDSG